MSPLTHINKALGYSRDQQDLFRSPLEVGKCTVGCQELVITGRARGVVVNTTYRWEGVGVSTKALKVVSTWGT